MRSRDRRRAEAIEARANAATAGTWGVEFLAPDTRWIENQDEDQVCDLTAVVNGETAEDVKQREADGAFIVAAHNTDIPALVAEVRRLQGLVAIAGEAIDNFMRYDGDLPVFLGRHIEEAHKALGGTLERSVTGGLPKGSPSKVDGD